MRNHRLRERRIKLGVSQDLVGQLAGFPAYSAQGMVSFIERAARPSPGRVQQIRAALVYLEAEPRRQRAWEREERRAVIATEAAIVAGDRDALVDRLVDLLCEGRGDDFDALGARLDSDIVEDAGEKYLTLSKPCISTGA
jgi:transcriptional regulator with XRE-family HTH domain